MVYSGIYSSDSRAYFVPRAQGEQSARREKSGHRGAQYDGRAGVFADYSSAVFSESRTGLSTDSGQISDVRTAKQRRGALKALRFFKEKFKLDDEKQSQSGGTENFAADEKNKAQCADNAETSAPEAAAPRIDAKKSASPEKGAAESSFWRILAFFIGFFVPPAGFALFFLWQKAYGERSYHTALGTLCGAVFYACLVIAAAVVSLTPFFS